MKSALLIVDIQNDYFSGGSNPLEGSLEAAAQAARLLDFFRRQDLPRLFVRHLSQRPGAGSFLPGTPGAEIHARVQPLPGEALIEKHFPNSFRETGLLDALRQAGVDHLVICGMMTHMCVDATVRAAVDAGFDVITAQDACATKSLSFDGQAIPAAQVHASFLAALNGAYGTVLPVEAILQHLEQTL
jgi:nicotinamidase-related amidase